MASFIKTIVPLYWFLSTVQAWNCYFPDGVKYDNVGMAPCNSTIADTTAGSACCDPRDSCSMSGMCLGASGYVYRGGCTDSTFGSANCPQFCLVDPVSNTKYSRNPNLYTCGKTGVWNTDFCCGSYAEQSQSCCDAGFTLSNGTGLAFKPGTDALLARLAAAEGNNSSGTSATAAVDSTVSTQTSAVQAAACSSNCASATASQNNKAHISIGIAAGVGSAVGLALVVIGLMTIMLFKQKKQLKRLQAGRKSRIPDHPEKHFLAGSTASLRSDHRPSISLSHSRNNTGVIGLDHVHDEWQGRWEESPGSGIPTSSGALPAPPIPLQNGSHVEQVGAYVERSGPTRIYGDRSGNMVERSTPTSPYNHVVGNQNSEGTINTSNGYVTGVTPGNPREMPGYIPQVGASRNPTISEGTMNTANAYVPGVNPSHTPRNMPGYIPHMTQQNATISEGTMSTLNGYVPGVAPGHTPGNMPGYIPQYPIPPEQLLGPASMRALKKAPTSTPPSPSSDIKRVPPIIEEANVTSTMASAVICDGWPGNGEPPVYKSPTSDSFPEDTKTRLGGNSQPRYGEVTGQIEGVLAVTREAYHQKLFSEGRRESAIVNVNRSRGSTRSEGMRDSVRSRGSMSQNTSGYLPGRHEMDGEP